METRVRPRRWLLLCTLALALVGMHHIPTASAQDIAACGPHAVPAAHQGPDHGSHGGHDMVHQCPVVRTAASGVLVAWLLLTIAGVLTTTVPVRHLVVRHRCRPPPRPAGRKLLTSVCVLRT